MELKQKNIEARRNHPNLSFPPGGSLGQGIAAVPSLQETLVMVGMVGCQSLVIASVQWVGHQAHFLYTPPEAPG